MFHTLQTPLNKRERKWRGGGRRGGGGGRGATLQSILSSITLKMTAVWVIISHTSSPLNHKGVKMGEER